jgi:hypothetical protein
MRCRAVLIALALLGIGASSGASSLRELAPTDIFRWSWPHGKTLNSEPQPITVAATHLVTSNPTTDSNPSAASVTALVKTNLPDTAVKPTVSLSTPGKVQTAGN